MPFQNGLGLHLAQLREPAVILLDYYSQLISPLFFLLRQNHPQPHHISEPPRITRITKMTASASEGDTANNTLLNAYPRDVIIQYVYKPTIVNHPILYVVFLCCLVLLAD